MFGTVRFWCIWLLLAGAARGYEMDEAARARLERHLPRTLAKLEARQPVHLLVVGDGTTKGFHYSETRNQALLAFPGIFARELAKEFFYTGGVRDLAPGPDGPAKIDESLGPEITIESKAVPEANVMYGFAPLTTDGFDQNPDLVMLHFGASAARECLPPADFELALNKLIRLVKEEGSDVLVIGPVPAPDGSNGMDSVAAGRAFASLMRDVATRQGVFFGDAGELLVEALPAPAEGAGDGMEAEFLQSLGRYFDHGPDIHDKRHLNAEAHELLGERLSELLLKGRVPAGISLEGSATELEGGFRVSLEATNPSQDEVSMVVMPLAIGAATRPVLREGASDQEVPLKLAGNGRGRLVWEYIEGAGGGWLPWMRCETVGGTSRVLRVPVLGVGEGGYTLLDVEAELRPIAVVWEFGNQFNVGGSWVFGANVYCQGDERWVGDYTVRCGDVVAQGSLSVGSGELSEIEAQLKVPGDGERRWKEEVVLELVSRSGERITQTHEVEFSRNMGLGVWTKLASKERYLEGSSGDPELGEGSVSMRVSADRDALFVEFDLRDCELVGSAQNASVIVDLSIDARYYTERGQAGFVGPLVVNAGAEDGAADVHLMELGVFGNGYDRKLAAKNVTAKLSTQGDGTRRVSVVIPRAYFYLHEWALENGNSQLGINAHVSLMRVSDAYPNGYYPLGSQYSLVNPGMARRDARSLTTLELTEKPTKRWSVRLY